MTRPLIHSCRARQQGGTRPRGTGGTQGGGEDLHRRGAGGAHRPHFADGRHEQGRVHWLPRVYSGTTKGGTERLDSPNKVCPLGKNPKQQCSTHKIVVGETIDLKTMKCEKLCNLGAVSLRNRKRWGREGLRRGWKETRICYLGEWEVLFARDTHSLPRFPITSGEDQTGERESVV